MNYGEHIISPSHGENRGSIPLGSANKINHLASTSGLCHITGLKLG
jgi:hypothetical protein